MDESQNMGPPMQKPGPAHAVLTPMVGRWKAQTKVYGIPNAPPFESQGAEVNYSIMGGLGVAFEYEADMGFDKFHGFGMITWNAAESCYQGYWCDCMMPAGPGPFKGHYDAAAHTMTSVMEAPMGDGQIIRQRMVDTIDGDQRTFEIYRLTPEGDQLSLHIDYTRDRTPEPVVTAPAAPRSTKAKPRTKPVAKQAKKKPAARAKAKTKAKAKKKSAKKQAKRRR